jgi:hypothetical protein
LVRALLCHFSAPILTPSVAPLESFHFCGFGEPEVDRALFSGAASASYLFQGEIANDTYLYLPFHVPQALVNATSSKLTIRGTLVFDPPVNVDDRSNRLDRRKVALSNVSIGRSVTR